MAKDEVVKAEAGGGGEKAWRLGELEMQREGELVAEDKVVKAEPGEEAGRV